jgi:serine/threonine protein kinase
VGITPELWETVKTLFQEALQRPSAERIFFLEQNCSNPDVRREVITLLAGYKEADDFLSDGRLERAAKTRVGRLRAGDILAGRFNILQFIAAGGMGEVYAAEDLELRERVAIKIISSEILHAPSAVARFKREVQLARKVTHPNICRLYDFFRHQHNAEPDLIFVSMELLEGETLSTRLHRQQRMTVDEALPIVTQMAAGLAAAHQASVVHRDFKPGNVMLVTSGTESMRAVITDFGLALRQTSSEAQSTVTTQQALAGTPAYMAPEVIKGEAATTACDIYALGLVMYEMVTGCLPFRADTPMQCAVKRLGERPVPPRQLVPELPARWEKTILRCLELEPSARFSSANDIFRVLTLKRDTQSAGQQTAISEQHQTLASSSLGSNAFSRGLAPPSTMWAAKRRRLAAITLITLVLLLATAGYWIYTNLKHSTPSPFSNFTPVQVSESGNVAQAAISPDGKYLSHVQHEKGKESLWLRNVPTDSETQVLPLSGSLYRSLVFSPDGNSIYYREATNRAGGAWNLYSVPILGGTPRLVVKNIDTTVTFSPDGTRIAYVRWQDPEPTDSRILSSRADGTDEQVLRTTSYNPTLMSVAWSPDGRWIACALTTPDNAAGGIDMFDVASRTMHRFVRWEDKTAVELKWLPNGKGLMLQYWRKREPGRAQIGFISYPDGHFRTITNDTSSYSGMSLSADASTLATVQETTTNEVSVLPSNGGAATTDVPLKSKRTINDLTWAHDGGMLWSDGTRLVHTAIDGSQETVLLSDASGRIPAVESCADGRSILFSRAYYAGSNSQNIWRADVDGSKAMQLSKGKLDVIPTCSPDGKWAYYTDIPRAAIMRVPMNGGTPEQVRGDTITDQVAISRDGRMLAYMAFMPENQTVYQRLALVNLANSGIKRFFDVDPRASSFVQFAPGSEDVAYTIEDRGIGNVWLQSLEKGTGRQITNFASGTIVSFHWSSNAKSLLVHRQQQTSDVVLLRESLP